MEEPSITIRLQVTEKPRGTVETHDNPAQPLIDHITRTFHVNGSRVIEWLGLNVPGDKRSRLFEGMQSGEEEAFNQVVRLWKAEEFIRPMSKRK